MQSENVRHRHLILTAHPPIPMGNGLCEVTASGETSGFLPPSIPWGVSKAAGPPHTASRCK